MTELRLYCVAKTLLLIPIAYCLIFLSIGDIALDAWKIIELNAFNSLFFFAVIYILIKHVIKALRLYYVGQEMIRLSQVLTNKKNY